jgi:hypothetical protein
MAFLRAEAVAQVPERDRFAELGAEWFTRAREELFPELDRGLRAGPSLAFNHAKDPDAPMGPPGGAYGTIWIGRGPMEVGGNTGRYSDRAWARMLGGLSTAYPYHAKLIASPLDERGLDDRSGDNAIIGVHRIHPEPEWVAFRVRASGYGDPGRWAEFVKRWVAHSEAAYAHVTDDPEIMGGTALEDATGRDIGYTIPRCREQLRGYSWVTVCAPELAARLGGPAALEKSGAFAEVTGLPGGQVFLRATRNLEDYQGEALRRVFDTLAPVLLAGRPRPMSSATARGRLVRDLDAADVQRR